MCRIRVGRIITLKNKTMKNIVLLILLIFVFFSCKDNETFFDASISRENIRFEPIPGGAVMHYALPEDTDIFAVRAVYDDYKGRKNESKLLLTLMIRLCLTGLMRHGTGCQ